MEKIDFTRIFNLFDIIRHSSIFFWRPVTQIS
jgi:hypothetical protein